MYWWYACKLVDYTPSLIHIATRWGNDFSFLLFLFTIWAKLSVTLKRFLECFICMLWKTCASVYYFRCELNIPLSVWRLLECSLLISNYLFDFWMMTTKSIKRSAGNDVMVPIFEACDNQKHVFIFSCGFSPHNGEDIYVSVEMTTDCTPISSCCFHITSWGSYVMIYGPFNLQIDKNVEVHA